MMIPTHFYIARACTYIHIFLQSCSKQQQKTSKLPMGLWNSSLGLSDLDCEVLGSDINGHFKNFQQKVHKSISNVGLHRPFEFKWLSKKTSRLVSRPSAFLAWVLTISTSFAPHRLTRWKVDLIQKTRGSLWKRRFLFDRFWYQKPRVLGQQSARFAWN